MLLGIYVTVETLAVKTVLHISVVRIMMFIEEP